MCVCVMIYAAGLTFLTALPVGSFCLRLSGQTDVYYIRSLTTADSGPKWMDVTVVNSHTLGPLCPHLFYTLGSNV